MAAPLSSLSPINRAGRLALPICQPVTVSAAPNLSDLPDAASLRDLAGEIRLHTLEHLVHYTEQLKNSVEQAGGNVMVAGNAVAARAMVDRLCNTKRFGSVDRRPGVLLDEVQMPLRFKPTTKSSGGSALITGGQFAIAQTGQVCICDDSEAIGQESADHIICLLGIESLVPRPVDLAVLLKMLSRSSAGRPMARQTRIIGPDEQRPGTFHLLLIDNGRRQILDGEHRDLLRCIGCGACASVCPVYQSDGVAVGATPIGAATAPLLAIARNRRAGETRLLPFASTLCGACSEICPVKIDIHRQLLRLRERMVDRKETSWWDRLRHGRQMKWLSHAGKFMAKRPQIWSNHFPGTARTKKQKLDFRLVWQQK